MKHLSPTEMQLIQGFISKRGFTYTDLSLEILAHVAHKVEVKMSQHPELSVEHALQQTHSEFGVMGFSVLEDSFVKSIQSSYNRLVILEFKNWFSRRNIGPLMACLLLVFGVARLSPMHTLSLFALLLNLSSLCYFFLLYRKQFKQFKNMLAFRSASMYFIGITSLLHVWIMSRHAWTPGSFAANHSLFFDGIFSVLFLINLFFLTCIYHILKNAIQRCETLSNHLIDKPI